MPLSELQSTVLAVLAGLEPPWRLTGGAAIVGFHLSHRTTRDLDLFWHGRDSIIDEQRAVTARLRAAGLEVSTMRSSASSCSLQVCRGDESVAVDLVAEPVAAIEPPDQIEHRGVIIQVDTAHELLVNKLCALLHRSELRDLIDVKALIAAGGDLERALSDAPAKDGGFSALTLGFCLRSWPIGEAARAAGIGQRAAELERFRDVLLARVAGEKP